jgi:hypothetical protein
MLADYIAVKMHPQERRDHVCDVNTISPVIVAHLTDVCPRTFTGRHLCDDLFPIDRTIVNKQQEHRSVNMMPLS